MTAAPASFSRRHVFLALRIPQTRGDALTRVPKQVERGRDGLRPVFDVRTVLLGKVRLQSGGDLVSGPQRRLHRVEAACLPINVPSRSLLLRTGFQQEGYARNYLLIDGKRQDHLLFAILKEDWRR